jgi:formate dehydrogenase iron-sulfur subunit
MAHRKPARSLPPVSSRKAALLALPRARHKNHSSFGTKPFKPFTGGGARAGTPVAPLNPLNDSPDARDDAQCPAARADRRNPSSRARHMTGLTPNGRLADPSASSGSRTLLDELIAEQGRLTAVERFSQAHERHELKTARYRDLLPATAPAPGQQYAFEVDLDQCSGCKACVTACHSLNGLDEEETWRNVGLLVTPGKSEIRNPNAEGNPKPKARNSDFAQRTSFGLRPSAFGIQQQHVTTACHHCADPGCLNGCPVLAYDKDPVTGIVRHLDDQCIGCQYCVMKCPYEVPQYSERLGIVRKCDMCVDRLAVGEAPACVQACPNEAITITLVDKAKVRGKYRQLNTEGRSQKIEGSPKRKFRNSISGLRTSLGIRHSTFGFSPFLPDSPNPAITLPTTRYRSANPALAQLVAADHAALRLDQPHWPLVIMLVLTQAAAGLALLPAALMLAGAAVPRALTIISLALLLVGMGAAVLHLGQPLKAWRAFLGWRKSWLSRELIAFNLFAGVASLAIGAQVSNLRVGALAALACWTPALLGATALLTVAASAMVYVDTQRPFWRARLTFGNFFGTTLLLGATFGAVIFGWLGIFAVAQPCALAALFIRTALFVWRRLEWRNARRAADSPIHLNARAIGELLAWTQRTNTTLFAASTAFGLLAIANVGGNAAGWASLAAAATFCSEIIARYVFFTASTAKRMPGGVAA